MSDILDATGLSTKSLSEIRAELEQAYRDIYGEDINLDQNSPDGQKLNITAQQAVDLRELLHSIYSSFDPDQAEGRVLDQRVALNGIERNSGTFTRVPVDVTFSGSGNLVGLDGAVNETDPEVENLFTVRDDAGNEFFLLESHEQSGAGTESLTFRAEDIGEVQVSPNTITTVVTSRGFVDEVNNPDGPEVLGEDEETDAALRIRRRISTAIGASTLADSIRAAILNLAGVTTVIVRENDTSATDSDDIPAHSFWVIVDGGENEAIATEIARRKTAGAGLKGDEEVTLTYNDGRPFIVRFDRPINQDLWIRFNVDLPDGEVDTENIKSRIVQDIIWDPGERARGDRITSFVLSLNPDYIVTGMEVSDDDSTYLEVVQTESLQHRFINSTDRISIT